MLAEAFQFPLLISLTILRDIQMPSASPFLFHSNRSNKLFLDYPDAAKLSLFKTELNFYSS